MFMSLPFTPRVVKATEARLEAIYRAAHLGLEGDDLALHAGMLPTEWRHLVELDPLASLAEKKGKADAQAIHAKTLHTASINGDAKAALEILKHKHGWVAKQQIDITSTTISITAALEEAKGRLIEHNSEDQRTHRLDERHDGATVVVNDAAVPQERQDQSG